MIGHRVEGLIGTRESAHSLAYLDDIVGNALLADIDSGAFGASFWALLTDWNRARVVVKAGCASITASSTRTSVAVIDAKLAVGP